MHLRFEIATRSLPYLFREAKGYHQFEGLDRDPGAPSPRCALCGAREYPHRFPLPHPWPRLHEVTTTLTTLNIDGHGLDAVLPPNDGTTALYLPIEDAAEVYGDDKVYLYRFCRYHGRPETSGWVDCLTNVKIEWFPEPSKMDLALFNIIIYLSYIAWVTGRFLWSLLTLRFIAVRFKIKRRPW